ncbi:MAG: twin-arginine translocase subunit TatC [Halobacteriota archaeon]
MSSALDEDTQRTLAEGRDTLYAILRSAQTDLQKVFVVFLVGFLLTFWTLRTYIWDWLRAITESRMRAEVGDSFDIIATTPFDVILLQAKIGLFVGVMIAIPVLLYFTRDALRDRGYLPQSPIPRWKIALVGGFAALLFTGGAAYGFNVFFPFMFGFLAEFGYDAGFAPTYSIVMWTEFIVLLTVSFGLAAQMPLFITALSYAEIVPYETFRDKWRHAVVGIFVFGAFFSPPDPFTQIMWAIPLIILYATSLYLAKVVVTAKRAGEQINVRTVARSSWNVLGGLFVAGVAVVYGYHEYGGRSATNDLLALAGSQYRILPPDVGFASAEVSLALYGAVLGTVFAVIGLAYFVYAELESATAIADPVVADPAAIDLSTLDEGGIRAAPPEAFAELTEEEALSHASQAIEADDPEKARAILDRFDETEPLRESDTDTETDQDDDASATGGDADAGDAPAERDLGDRTSDAGETFLEELTDGETDSDDIGGYYTDVVFIFDSLRSRSFRIVATFLVSMAAVFAWLYVGGLRDVRVDFYSRLPEQVTAESVSVITLHPVEALIFMVKFSVLVAVLVTLPVIAYYAWPSLRELGFVRGRQRVVYVWTAALTGGMVGGFVLGYAVISPVTISYLAADALAADMIISYRINDFMWLIIFTTAGIGFLADIPIVMILLNSAGVPYASMRKRWREVFITMLTLAAVFTPADIITMLLVAIPLLFAYGVGLLALFFVTFGGRRDLAPPAEVIG